MVSFASSALPSSRPVAQGKVTLSRAPADREARDRLVDLLEETALAGLDGAPAGGELGRSTPSSEMVRSMVTVSPRRGRARGLRRAAWRSLAAASRARSTSASLTG